MDLMKTVVYLQNEASSQIEKAAWELFFEESIDAPLRVAILQQVLKIKVQKLTVSQELNPNQMRINNYSDCLDCGKESFQKLTEW